MISLPLRGSQVPVNIAPTKIICLGLNYRDHVKESQSVLKAGDNLDVPAEPVLFAKTPNTIVGPGTAIVLPQVVDHYQFAKPRTDLESELAVVVGERCRNVPADRWASVVLGFTCANDVSQRNIQLGDRSGWFRGKSFDTFCPLGPEIVPVNTLPNPLDLAITGRLNGTVVQQSRTSLMIFGLPEIIAFITRNLTLEAGDIILTGTPAGVSAIKPGDVVSVEIEGIGVLSNPVVAE